MRVLELWRYPVKSLQGERLTSARLLADGLEGDRRWSLVDPDTGVALTARKVPHLLFAGARWRPGGGVEVVLPDGSVTDDDATLSRFCGRRVELREITAGEAPRHDEEGASVTLLSTGTLARAGDGGPVWDPRRFRPNVLLDGDGEEDLVGAAATLGDAAVAVFLKVPRCVMVTRPQAGGIGRDTGVLRAIHRRGGVIAVGAGVLRPGTTTVGDELLARDRD